MSYIKTTEVEVVPGVNFGIDSALFFLFGVGPVRCHTESWVYKIPATITPHNLQHQDGIQIRTTLRS